MSVSPPSSSFEGDSDSNGDNDSDVPNAHDEYNSKVSPRSIQSWNPHLTNSRDILLFLIAFRILNALCIRTFFQPDEFFQSLEPAWEWAFGADSGAWITWEWKNQLRSSIHPAIFAGVYWLSACLSRSLGLSPDSYADLLIAAPKVTQAVIAALGDYYTWKLGERVYGRGSNEARATLAVTVFSPWQWFCSTRTLSNCLETTLTIAALYLWPWEWSLHGGELDNNDDEGQPRNNSSIAFSQELRRLRGSLLLAALACVLRPTNILIWISITYFALFGSATQTPFRWADWMIWISVPSLDLLSSTQRRRKTLVREIVINGSAILVLSALIDRLYYQQWTFPPLHFLHFNIFQSVAIFYGRNDWHYYLTQGFPLLLTTLLPFTITGLYQALTNSNSTDLPPSLPSTITHQLSTTTLLPTILLSLISPHKEVRFIYPLLPALHILSARPLTNFFRPPILYLPPPKRLLLLSLLTTNLTLALLSTTYHQPAPLNVLTFLRTQHTTHYLSSQPPSHSSLSPASTQMTIGFLTPCHSTPWRSHLIHPDIKAWALTCDPPLHLNTSSTSTYKDEADTFYANPSTFLSTHLGPPLPKKTPFVASSAAAWDGGAKGAKGWPEYLVFFAQLEDLLRDVLRESRYRECWRGWNSWGHDDWRRRGDLVVWCLE